MVLEKTFENPLDSKEIKPVNSKENQHWILTGRTEAEAPILWPPDAKSWLIGKDPDSGKDWSWKEENVTEDEMIGWHRWFNGTWTWANSRRWWGTKKPEHWRIDTFKLWSWRTLESPLDSKKIKPVNLKGSQPWILTGRTEAEAPILWPHDVKNRLIGKDPDAG